MIVLLLTAVVLGQQCSQKFCEEDKDDLWGTGSYASPAYIDVTSQQGFGDTSVCAQSKITLPGQEEAKCYGTGTNLVNHFDAINICNKAGARLCTASELQADDSHGSGCNYDFQWVWSSTPCEDRDEEQEAGDASACNGGGGYLAYPGFSDAAPEGVYQCISPLESGVAVVRCCRDACDSEKCDYPDCVKQLKETVPPYEGSSNDACSFRNSADARGDALCVCSRGSDVTECSTLGTSVGSQSSGGEGGCLVVDCGGRGLTQMPFFPDGATKVDLQNNPSLTIGALGGTGEFNNLQETTWLYVQNVPVTTIEPFAFRFMDKLVTLEISFTDLVDINVNSFQGANALETLTFADNSEMVKIAGGALAKAGNLKALQFTSLAAFDFERSGFANIRNLETFTANNCAGITRIPANLFQGCGNLNSITFESNENLAIIEDNAFSGAGSVEVLRLIELKMLTHFESSSNKFFGLSGLKTLVIKNSDGNGGLERIGSNDFFYLSALETVELDIAALSSVASGVFSTMQRLKSVTIAGSPKNMVLESLPPTLFAGVQSSIEEIVLEGLAIESPSLDGLFDGLGSLKSLKISCMNALESIEANQFYDCTSLEKLSIMNNVRFVTLAPGAFTNLKKLQELVVTGNINLGRLESGTFDHAFDDEASSVVINLEGNGINFMSPRAVNFDADGAPSQAIVVVSSADNTGLDFCCAYEWMVLDTHYVTNGLKCNTLKPQASTTFTNFVDLVAVEATQFGCCLSKFNDEWAEQVEYLHTQAINGPGGDDIIGAYENLDVTTKDYLAETCSQSRWDGPTKVDANGNACASPEECPPSKMEYFNQKFVPSINSCNDAFGDFDELECPIGHRVENIGKRYLLDCEPWVHEEREYVTRHAVAELQCVKCVVQNCAVCNENYRHCDECDHDHSLFVDPETNVHNCVLTQECPGERFSTNANEDVVHTCQLHTVCVQGQEETLAPTKLSDRECEPIDITTTVVSSVLPVLAFAAGILLYLRWKYKKKTRALQAMYGELHDSMSSVKTVVEGMSYDGGMQERALAKAAERAAEILAGGSGGGGAGGGSARPRAATTIASETLIKQAKTDWYWEESPQRVDNHAASTMLPGTNFVRFPKVVSNYLELGYHQFANTDNGSPQCALPAHNSKWVPKEADDGRGIYFYHQDTKETKWVPPADYQVDYTGMTQTKVTTNFVRNVKRVELEAAVYAGNGGKKKTKEEEKASYSPWKKKVKLANTTNLPDEVLEQDGLIIHDGDMVQVKAETDDKLWTYGTILIKASDDTSDSSSHGGGSHGPSTASSRVSRAGSGNNSVHHAHSVVINSDETGVSNETGWFPTNCIRETEPEEFKKVKHLLGSATSDALAEPSTWDDVPKDKRFTAHRFTLPDGAERRRVCAAFQRSLKKARIPITVVDVERIQNYAMWQSYAVKKTAITNREKGYDANADAKKFVRGENDDWLFHGTNSEVLPKIIQQGFNRSFCGKNATFYGKGVYFARDSAYSCKPHYAQKDSRGHQYMLLTRVVVGAFHEGRKDILTPDLRYPELDVLFDSTCKGFKVGFSDTSWITQDDRADDPQIYVTYHDAQAYPEYLVKFKQGNDGSSKYASNV